MVSSESHSERATVAVVEDEQGLADLYTEWLGDSYSTRTAYNGEQALDVIDETVNVVLLDRRMPGLSGDDVLDRLREREHDYQVVMVTAVTPDFDVFELPFDDYVVKPLSEQDIHDVVRRMLTRETYDDQMQRLFGLVSKKATLEATKSDQELESSDEFAALEAEIETLQAELDESVAKFDTEDFDAVMQDL